jgi:lipopolysaccharide transport system ATP-binding protein
MSDKILIKVESVSKKFCRNLKRSLWYGMKDLGREIFGQSHGGDGTLRSDEFWAVDNVSFELKRGECLGLIGRNGAGKTTLLRMLNGLIKPDSGRIEMRGRVGALIALGAGFNPVLTGRENVYINGSILGFSTREIDSLFNDIVEFAELEEFMDTPVGNYSSGMKIRLGFAVASSLDVDILLLDEVLAVGDAAFRDKCYHRIANLRRKAAVIFVSHSMEQVARTCTQVLTLQNGRTVHLGDVESGIRIYEEINYKNSKKNDRDGFLSIYSPISHFSAKIEKSKINTGEQFEADIEIVSERDLMNYLVKILFYNARGTFSADGAISSTDLAFTINQGHNSFRIVVQSLPLKRGTYAVAFNLVDEFGDLVVWSYKLHHVAVTGAYVGGIADCQLQIYLNRL